MDDMLVNGQWYIASPPGLSFFSLPFVVVGFLLVGGYSPFGWVLLLSEAFIALAGAITVYLMYKVSRFFFGEKTSLFLSLALGFSTLLWPFATYYFQHDLSAMFALLAVYLALKIAKNFESGKRSLPLFLLCGVSLGCALLVDYIDAALIPVVFVYLLYKTRKLTGIFYYLCGAVTGIVTLLAYNVAAFGNALTTSQNMYDKKPFLGDFSTPVLQGLFWNFLSPYRGLFLFCPITILAPIGFYLVLKKSASRTQGLFVLAAMLSIVIPYSMWQDVTAGVSFGPRFLIPAIPFLILPIGYVIDGNKIAKNFAYLLFAIGVVLNGSDALVSVIHPNFTYIPPWTTEIFTSVLTSFRTGNLDVWWISMLGQYWWVLAFSVVAFPIVFILLTDRLVPDDHNGTGPKETHSEEPAVVVPLADIRSNSS